MLKNRFISKKRSLTILSCVASVLLLASCTESTPAGGTGTATAGPFETTTGGTGSGGTGTGTVTGGTGTGTVTGGTGTGTVTGGTGGTGTGTVTGGTGGTGTGTSTTGTGTSTTGTGTSTGGDPSSDQILGLWQLNTIAIPSEGIASTEVPPGSGYLDIGTLESGNLSFILLLQDFDLNCLDVVVATPMSASNNGTDYVVPSGEVIQISRTGNSLAVDIDTVQFTFSPSSGISFSDLQICS